MKSLSELRTDFRAQVRQSVADFRELLIDHVVDEYSIPIGKDWLCDEFLAKQKIHILASVQIQRGMAELVALVGIPSHLPRMAATVRQLCRRGVRGVVTPAQCRASLRFLADFAAEF